MKSIIWFLKLKQVSLRLFHHFLNMILAQFAVHLAGCSYIARCVFIWCCNLTTNLDRHFFLKIERTTLFDAATFGVFGLSLIRYVFVVLIIGMVRSLVCRSSYFFQLPEAHLLLHVFLLLLLWWTQQNTSTFKLFLIL